MNFEHEAPASVFSQRIDAYLTKALEGKFSREEVKNAIEAGKVSVNGKPVRKSYTVEAGDKIRAEIVAKTGPDMTGENIPIHVLYEDESILVVEKPVGMVVHPGAGVKSGTLAQALVGRGGSLSSIGGVERPGIVHRLDKDTSGILLVARNNQAHRALQAQFASRSLSKTYTVLVKGRIEFEEGHILEPIGHDPKVRGRMAVSHHEKARDAESHYRVVERFRYATLAEVRIVTGRTHQIRVHMKHIGYPVVGDAIYGSGKPGDRLCLHASKIEFSHPKSGKLMSFKSPVPADMQAVIEKARHEEDIR